MPVDNGTFRELMSNFATGCTVLTLPEDSQHGMTANAVSSVSLDPPLVLVCVDHDTECYEQFEEGADGYCLNILAEHQQDLGEFFADLTELAEDPFETRPTTTEVTGAPVFEESIAYLDCSLETAHEAGDHTIYVGRVESGDVLNGDDKPLLFFRGEWGGIADE
jgi:flavin reductase (DIM6/NTAB) family NADH-FMN oxidoreductase RutF